MRCVTYSRVSTSNHDQKPEVQVEALRDYCRQRGWVIAEEIVDHGFSGGTDKRPGLKNLMSLVKSRKVDAVVVVKMDRLFRSLKHLVSVLDEFHSVGVLFISVGDQIDMSTASGRLMTQILGAFSEFERALVRERTIAGLAFARSRGQTLGRPKTRDDSAILKLRQQGLSYTEIQRRLGCERSAVYRALKAMAKTSSRTDFQAAEKTRSRKRG